MGADIYSVEQRGRHYWLVFTATEWLSEGEQLRLTEETFLGTCRAKDSLREWC